MHASTSELHVLDSARTPLGQVQRHNNSTIASVHSPGQALTPAKAITIYCRNGDLPTLQKSGSCQMETSFNRLAAVRIIGVCVSSFAFLRHCNLETYRDICRIIRLALAGTGEFLFGWCNPWESNNVKGLDCRTLMSRCWITTQLDIKTLLKFIFKGKTIKVETFEVTTIAYIDHTPKEYAWSLLLVMESHGHSSRFWSTELFREVQVYLGANSNKL